MKNNYVLDMDTFDELNINNPFELDKEKQVQVYKALKEHNEASDQEYLAKLLSNILDHKIKGSIRLIEDKDTENLLPYLDDIRQQLVSNAILNTVDSESISVQFIDYNCHSLEAVSTSFSGDTASFI